MTTPDRSGPAETNDPSRLSYSMVRATWRDIAPLAWLMSVEFTRPTRVHWPFLPATLVVFPIFLGVAAMPGVYHYDRKSVLGLARRGDGRYRRVGVGLFMVAVMVAELGALLPAFGSWAFVVWTGSLIGGFGLPRGLGVLARALKLVPAHAPLDDVEEAPVDQLHRRRLPSLLLNPPPSDWFASVAASRPTQGLSALHDVFVPHVLATVPVGETVGLVAANRHLANVYRNELGFVQTGPSPLQMRATM